MTETKTCTKCGEKKPLDGFHRDKTKRDGRLPSCKECATKRVRRYYAENHDRALESQRRYREENREILAAKARDYYADNREQVLAYWSARHRENPHIKWANYYRERCARYGLPVTVEEFTKADVIDRYGPGCFYCGGDFQELDHYVPVSKGGPHALENVRPSCLPCNRKKNDT